MLFLWFLLFLAWPVAEIAIFVQVGQAIGWPATILLTLATAIGGAYLLRVQGFRAMSRFLQSTEEGDLPVAAVLDSMGIFTAGMLLLLPGFISDALGLLLFIPPFRRWLIARLFWQVLDGGIRQGGPFRRTGGQPKSGFRKSDKIVDAEFETLDPDTKKPQRPSLPGDGTDRKPRQAPDSPWRDG